MQEDTIRSDSENDWVEIPATFEITLPFTRKKSGPFTAEEFTALNAQCEPYKVTQSSTLLITGYDRNKALSVISVDTHKKTIEATIKKDEAWDAETRMDILSTAATYMTRIAQALHLDIDFQSKKLGLEGLNKAERTKIETIYNIKDHNGTEILAHSFVDVTSHPAEPVAAPAPAAAAKNSPPTKAFFEGFLRSKSDEEKAVEAEKRDAQEIAAFRASLPVIESDAEVEVGLSGNLPQLGLLKNT